MRFFLAHPLLLLIVLSNGLAFSQIRKAGPVIENYGAVWEVEDQDFSTDPDVNYKAVFDVMSSPESHAAVNPSIETVARYLNMHAQNGVPRDHIKAALIIHNKASKDIMNQEAYRERYGVENPNHDLIKALAQAGVEIVFCGQSSHSREIGKEKIIAEVQLSLSAMTALIQLQDRGYRLIKF